MPAPTAAQVSDAIAARLHERGVATFTPDGVYPATVTQPAVYLGELFASPDPAVAINHYYTDGDPMLVSNPLMRFELMWRGDRDPKTVHRLADAGHDVLHTLTPGSWPGGVRLLWCVRQIVTPIETDESGRWMRGDSYEIQLNPSR
ncbi:minor capsid protein [Gordonia sp. (in: high G+C Gram-positive bacteria)]|uniref:minor capsid protein n=1 Tax=Gordonia sp. (in: high G+C Gram-positive bacteria) TaxID=84139 RepID=UPI00333F611D